ncbi:MAG: 2-oxoacid:acceptor oxidoreductase subunit alpha [Bacteroidales bacterium]|jgi:2-oxoglutarate ferredoxin oxidoreductase subunit alpha|nr:2-oxoacid:acceptor oxidoreductase subunit alpha [Bacteroidales bacterium]NCU35842.1 2-oxoacid:acceptor oxidoreductase subunit alpha [Candidatus Falkowbacteria bacterium]MDD3130221.1 2-oxoacid:acceptor oxidoreductase subunit alpha [Bacteroidales bacterium]MDD4176814.1 2-oxoacid:acceptor oxidoreductase subunit alpha [Bacteroidales bacterium]MDD4741940.1 2-oxoacid:acceptor oxidoreductase subunit alpha [Bacteroidales bacterium]
MTDTKDKITELDDVVIRFSGDSGDGMQLTGTLFSDTSALLGNDLLTFPDYPAEIRAPQGTIGGVSGFQVHFGQSEINTPGDYADVLVAMNPAALTANIKWIKRGGTIIIDIDSFTEKNIERAGCVKDPLQQLGFRDYNIVKAPITTLTREALKGLNLDSKSILRSKNMFALGMVYWLFHRPLEFTKKYIEDKFKKIPVVIEANKTVLKAGYYYAETVEALHPSYSVAPASIEPGTYRNINGNIATAWGLIAAAEKAGRKLFLGSYPITPASEILQELSKRKDLGVKTFQAEDEIAGVCTAIGASFAGHLAVTSTSGPGLSLKTEAIGLAIIMELPLVIVNVQRGGPSTGLPTKTEQSDLMQALYGRHGESPLVVMAASSPRNCFDYAFEAARIALEHMTPVILLTDGFLANGSEPWRIPDIDDLPAIHPPIVEEGAEDFQPYRRINDELVRGWAVPGTKGLEHRLGGLEKMAITGAVSYVPENHQVMTYERENKVKHVQRHIPDVKVYGDTSGEMLLIGWGGTFGHLYTAYRQLKKEGYKLSFVHFNYIKPLPANTHEVLKNFKKLLVCELNLGQFASYLRLNFQDLSFMQYNKIQGLPFKIEEIKEQIKKQLEVQ